MYKICIRCAVIANNVIPVINYIPQYEASGGMYIQVHTFLTWALRGGEWSGSQTVNIVPDVY
jgi:hypothetical protein